MRASKLPASSERTGSDGFRVVLTLTDTSLLQPRLFTDLIASLEPVDRIVGVVLLDACPKHQPWWRFVRRMRHALGLKGLVQIAARLASNRFRAGADRLWGLKEPVSLRAIALRHGIRVHESREINEPDTLAWMRACAPDLIVNSAANLFGPEALSIPTVACINKHCSLLPAYRGVFPVFWALMNGERQTGVSVHIMERDVDTGPVISQTTVEILPNDTHFALLARCFAASGKTIADAISRIRAANGQFDNMCCVARAAPAVAASGSRRTYWTYPTRSDALRFAAKGLRFV